MVTWLVMALHLQPLSKKRGILERKAYDTSGYKIKANRFRKAAHKSEAIYEIGNVLLHIIARPETPCFPDSKRRRTSVQAFLPLLLLLDIQKKVCLRYMASWAVKLVTAEQYDDPVDTMLTFYDGQKNFTLPGNFLKCIRSLMRYSTSFTSFHVITDKFGKRFIQENVSAGLLNYSNFEVTTKSEIFTARAHNLLKPSINKCGRTEDSKNPKGQNPERRTAY
ncbi:hypothetical protein M513_09526 [Trichuris suis]|uniref:Uncharacterized protein n=1 Tax=Trichuris suis TaxID=68888 RepID=A0A085LX87_9BILA|nr:hypothetical protein M513_09526 [Trichuris suis]